MALVFGKIPEKVSSSPRLLLPNQSPLRSCSWKSESIAALISLASLFIILPTLLPQQGRPIPEWPLVISANSLLSIYITVVKACLAYVINSCVGQLGWVNLSTGPSSLRDLVRVQHVGRGGLDSAAWFWRSRVLQNPFISLAALMAILTIVMDPIAQQLIRPAGCLVPMNQVLATLPRTSFLNLDNIVGKVTGMISLQEIQQQLISSAFAKPEALKGECPTGNCTFPKFRTAAYCSSCTDISSSMSFNYSCNWLDPMRPTGEDRARNLPKISSSIKSLCNKTGPAFGDIKSQVNSTWNTSNLWQMQENYGERTNLLTSQIYGSTALYELVVGQTGFSVNNLSPLSGEPLEHCQNAEIDEWRCRGYGAASCRLYPCVRTYETSVQNGEVHERLLEKTTLKDLQSIPYWAHADVNGVGTAANWIMLDTECVNSEDKILLGDRGINLDKRWVAYEIGDFEIESVGRLKDIETADFPQSLMKRDCAYAWSGLTDTFLYTFLLSSRFMTGSVNCTIISEESSDTRRVISFMGPQELQKLYNGSLITFSQVQNMFDDLADGFTRYIRTHGHREYSQPTKGSAWQYNVCLQVDWAWIVGPAGLWLGVMVLFCFTVLSTSKSKIPVWKTSPLPLVLRCYDIQNFINALEGESPEEREALSHMDQLAGRITIQIDYTGDRKIHFKIADGGLGI